MMVEVSTPTTITPSVPAGERPGPGTYGHITAWLSKRVEIALAQIDLTLPQYRVLGILSEGSAAASGLAQRLAVRPPSITAVIDGLVARGLVDRSHEESDRRRITLRLTAEGERMVAAADLCVDEYLESIAACLPDPDELMVLRSLELWGHAMANFHQMRKQVQ